MNLVVCPHCKSHRIMSSKVPKDVIVIMPCPSCDELVLLFRKKAMALNRRILEQGSFDERKEHISSIVAEFLQSGVFTFKSFAGRMQMDESEESGPAPPPNESRPISDKDFERFTRVELKRIDDPEYFKKHFG